MNRDLTLAVLAGLTFGLAGCSTYSAAPEKLRVSKPQVVVPAPAGWLVYNGDKAGITITRDGLELERVSLRATPCDTPVAGTARVYRQGMLPLEIADLSLGLLEARDDMKNVVIADVSLISIAGHDGYRAEVTYITPSGLPKRKILIGCLVNGYVFEMLYDAADPVYYQKYLPVFMRMVAGTTVTTG